MSFCRCARRYSRTRRRHGMPIVDVEIVLNDGQSLRANLAAELAEVIGSVFESPKGRTWVRLRSLARGNYGENGGTPEYAQPVFVTILKAEWPQGEALKREMRLLTNAIAAIVDRNSDSVHILYEPDAKGRIAFGGELVE